MKAGKTAGVGTVNDTGAGIAQDTGITLKTRGQSKVHRRRANSHPSHFCSGNAGSQPQTPWQEGGDSDPGKATIPRKALTSDRPAVRPRDPWS